jgi:hypothetical protein
MNQPSNTPSYCHNMKATSHTLLRQAIALAALLSGAASGQTDPLAAASAKWGFIEQYCTKCHNYDDFSGGLALEGLEPATLHSDPAIWEEVLLKLRAGMMPPAGQPRPAQAENRNFIKALESSLDAVAALQPHPGSKGLHRLNRTEYATAVEELLGVKVNASDLLPRDDEASGFDNAASVLKVSPSFLEQYMLAAREVSILAVGDPDAATTGRVYSGDPGASQNAHRDGLPLGTRGGMLVEHHFPADGEYEFTVSGLVGGGYVWGVMDENTLIITINDEKIFEGKVGDREDLRAVDIDQAVGIGAIDERFKNIRHFVPAGTHKVGVSFIQRSAAVQLEPLHGFVPVDGMAVLVQGVSGGPRISNVGIRGPYNPVGVSDTASRRKLFTCYPRAVSEERACAEQILGSIARKAFRRPITALDLDGAMEFYAQGREGGSFDDGIQKGLMAILSSPNFLYRAHTPPADVQPGDVFTINDMDLASRLSFFLWSQGPDEQLIQLALNGQLNDPDVLAGEVQRMLRDEKSRTLVTNFAFQWLHVDGLTQVNPDRTLFPQFTGDLIQDFEQELELFIASIFDADRPVHDLLTADHTFLNERLSLHYGLNMVRGGQFQRVALTDAQRFGLLGKGAVLMTTSYANRTSPVIRGAYILDKLIGTPPPAPPPDVEAFPEVAEGEQHLTVRERLESHRDNPACRSCHSVIDPLGLALENYNSIGQWQDKDPDAGIRIDASGQLTDGTPVASPEDLWRALTNDPELFALTFTRKLMTFALGRPLDHYDMPAVRAIVRSAAQDQYRLSSIVIGIVQSDAFRKEVYQSSDAGNTPAEASVAANEN